ncbi:MAG: hypothetical protein H0V73_08030 [Chloroflexi bacterium]|nr:hypothetical protein [Chloroflexota bacterium]
MNQTLILVLGTIAWTFAAVDAAVHLVDGDMLVPAGMAAILVAWVAIRRQWLRTQLGAPIRIEAETR